MHFPKFLKKFGYPWTHIRYLCGNIFNCGYVSFVSQSILINKANGWLQQNPGVRVVCCESVESKAKMNTVVADTSKSTFYEYGERSNWFHRTLRSCSTFN